MSQKAADSSTLAAVGADGGQALDAVCWKNSFWDIVVWSTPTYSAIAGGEGHEHNCGQMPGLL